MRDRSAALSPAERERLARLLGMLGSDHDGEVASADHGADGQRQPDAFGGLHGSRCRLTATSPSRPTPKTASVAGSGTLMANSRLSYRATAISTTPGALAENTWVSPSSIGAPAKLGWVPSEVPVLKLNSVKSAAVRPPLMVL
jgi:hypothetical protein